MSEPIVFCDNLVKIYKLGEIEVLALQGLELAVQKGEMVGIIGASGSGKTTLMNVLGGLVRPTAGRVLVNGHNLLKLSDSEINRYRRNEVGFVWQQGARNLIPYLNALENVEFPMLLAGQSNKETRQRAERLLDMVGLSPRRDHYLPMLSGGEQQRVAIAVALANEPAILLADEPTGELDTVTALAIYEALQTLNRELGLTILIVSHDRMIARHVDRVVAIRDGKTASETVRTRPRAESQTVTVEEAEAGELDHHFEELTVLDSAGRLQIPEAYREALAIGDRVTLELTEDGVLVKPVASNGQPAVAASVANQLPAPKEKPSWVGRLWGNRGKRSS
ncbi:MAG: ATP-binding cassette domain-containing protein [Anaerolineales bacterium]|nr:ATP-binding cassette domain-containing protein [Anaerolineales bacterium]